MNDSDAQRAKLKQGLALASFLSSTSIFDIYQCTSGSNKSCEKVQKNLEKQLAHNTQVEQSLLNIVDHLTGVPDRSNVRKKSFAAAWHNLHDPTGKKRIKNTCKSDFFSCINNGEKMPCNRVFEQLSITLHERDGELQKTMQQLSSDVTKK